MRKLMAALFVLLYGALSASAQVPDRSHSPDPYAIQGVANGRSLAGIREEIRIRLSTIGPDDCKEPEPDRARYYAELAELMKRVGDYRAEIFYECAIKADTEEPVYDFLFAEYLRNFRGAQHPSFPEAEKHYYDARRKLGSNPSIGNLIERGLVALYGEDGIPVAHRGSEIPFWFFSTVNYVGRLTTDPDREDDVRSYTSEALLAATRTNPTRELTETELNRIIRAKDQFETTNRFRFRYKNAPAFDLFYKHREINDAQITRFANPNEFNDVKLNEYGVGVEKPLYIAPLFDVFFRSSYKRIDRQGLLEFQPAAFERINQYEANTVVSRYVGPDKINLEFVYAYQDIRPEGQPKRDRSIIGGEFTYQLFRRELQEVYNRRFDTRGIDFFLGALYDDETFGGIHVKKKDFFFGTALKGIGRFDFTVQPTLFTSDVEGDKTQENSQYRTNLILLFRILDEEKRKESPAFLHLVFPFRHDVALEGPKEFENFKAGVGLNAKLFTRGDRRTTFLVSISYDHQRFTKLDKALNLFGLNFSVGF
jgi:hypothetical protein